MLNMIYEQPPRIIPVHEISRADEKIRDASDDIISPFSSYSYYDAHDRTIAIRKVRLFWREKKNKNRKMPVRKYERNAIFRRPFYRSPDSVNSITVPNRLFINRKTAE